MKLKGKIVIAIDDFLECQSRYLKIFLPRKKVALYFKIH